MKKYTFRKFYAYTDHLGADHEGIERGNFSEFPDFLVLPNADVVYLIESIQYCENVTSSGYAVIDTSCGEIRIRVTHSDCPNYKHGKHGSRSSLMEIRTAIDVKFELVN